MYKIERLTLHNFKFFYGNRLLDFEQKHVLLYGENGSGKSSIYWALFTFFHSVFKPDPRQIQKYFLPITRSEESLKNRYAKDEEDSYIEILFENELSDSRTKKISNTVVNTRTDNFIEEIILTSDLIDYKSIFNFYNFTNKSRVKLFGYFERHLMPFITLRTPLNKADGTTSNNLEVWWNYLKEGLIPHPAMASPEYAEFQRLVSVFNNDFEYYLNKITETANNYIKDQFKEEFQIEFDYQDCTYNQFNEYNKGRNRVTTPPEIFLRAKLIDENLNEASNDISRVHTFLNEAKLSSIALAIRMAILKEKFVRDSPKILVLDDLLLSLDMGNREVVLSIIVEEYLDDYQLIILTHDKVFFQSAFSFIKAKYSGLLKNSGEVNTSLLDMAYSKYWKIFELYETTLPDGKRIPSITIHKSYLQKAYHYFNDQDNIDYNACGNNLRSALEEVLREVIPRAFLLQGDGTPIADTGLTLNTLIVKCIDYFIHLGFNVSVLDRLNRYRERALNQTSHYNPKSNYFKKELQDTFKIINELNRYRFDVVVKFDDLMNFSVFTENQTEYVYTFKLLDNIRLYQEPREGALSFYSVGDKRTYALKGFSNNGKTHIISSVTSSLTLDEFYDETIRGLAIRLGQNCVRHPDVFSVFKTMDGRSLQDLKRF